MGDLSQYKGASILFLKSSYSLGFFENATGLCEAYSTCLILPALPPLRGLR